MQSRELFISGIMFRGKIMKITKNQLRRIIQEEIRAVLKEEARFALQEAVGTMAQLENIFGEFAELFSRTDKETNQINMRKIQRWHQEGSEGFRHPNEDNTGPDDNSGRGNWNDEKGFYNIDGIKGWWNSDNSNIIIYLFANPMGKFPGKKLRDGATTEDHYAGTAYEEVGGWTPGIPPGRFFVLHPTAGVKAHYDGDLNLNAVMSRIYKIAGENFKEVDFSVPRDPVAYKQMYGDR